MAIDPEKFVFALGLILVLAFAGHIMFRRTRMPDVLLLVLLGVVLGPWLGWLPVDAIQAMIPLVGIAAIVIILFDGGIKLNISDLLGGLGPAFGLGVLSFTACTLLVAGIFHFVTGTSAMVSLILGCILGGTSSIVVMPLANAMRIEKRTKTVLGLESVLTDTLVIVGVLTFSTAVELQETNPQTFVRDFVQLFALGAAFGTVAGFAWVHALRRFFEERSYEYMLTMSALAVLYTATEFMGGAPAVAVLAFGLVLGNGRRTRQLTGRELATARRKRQRTWTLVPVFDTELVRLHDEMVFFIRAFFFVALGAILDVTIFQDPAFLALSLVFLAAVLVSRLWALLVVQWRLAFPPKDLAAVLFLNGRGIAAAAVASIPFTQFGILSAEAFPAYALGSIVLTNLSTSAAIFVIENRSPTGRAAPA